VRILLFLLVSRTEEYDALVLEMDQLKETLHSLQNSNSTQELETKCDSLTDKMKKLQVGPFSMWHLTAFRNHL